MTELHVRLEAVNLSNFVHDVHDLSTIRGGSFLLLDAVSAVQKELGLTAISTGASMGLFSCATADPPCDVRARIERRLHDDERFRHATFVVDVRPVGGFARTREELTSMNRWRQFQQPTVAIPRTPGAAARECSFDGVRPADLACGGEAVSASVAVRRRHGLYEKQKFYADELRELRRDGTDEALETLIEQAERAEYAGDLESLTSDPSRKRLHWKMAVLYFDGNEFGKRQRACASPAEQAAFDRRVKKLRRTVLRGLLERIFASKDNGWWTADGAVRLETLLWGGDELTWVVPSWKAWETLRIFYDLSASADTETPPLTHAGGVAFCHRGAPIHRITRMAHELADLCKDFLRSTKPHDTHADRDLFAYQVFESFDLVNGPLDAFRATRVPAGRPASDLLVRGSSLAAVSAELPLVRRSFPRSKLHDIVLGLLTEPQDALIAETIARLRDDECDALRRLFRVFGGPEDDQPWLAVPSGWFHLAELWDYAAPETGEGSAS